VAVGSDNQYGLYFVAMGGGGINPLRLCAALPLLVAGGCVFMPDLERYERAAVVDEAALLEIVEMPDPSAPRLPPLETRHVGLTSLEDEVVGETQVIFSRYENTFVSIARHYNVGYQSLRHANPDVDHWLPGEETPVYLPSQSVLPDAPRDGIVINLANMRLYYFTPGEEGLEVTTHPIGIGREGWATPTGSAQVTEKVLDPAWYPPASVRADHAARGDPLPSIVPPGPDNPLGRHAIALSMPGYLIHGTNQPAGVGMRVSAGCIRLYPEDIEALFERVARGTPVYIVDQPVLAGWRGDELYLAVHRPLSEYDGDLAEEAEHVLAKALERRGASAEDVDRRAVEKLLAEQRGIPLPVLRSDPADQHHLAQARIVENTVPLPEGSATARVE
jgi:L,D-transpeptidase ErfK/SrfK